MEEGPEEAVKGDMLVKLRKERRKLPPRVFQKTQSANLQQLEKLQELTKEAEVPGDSNSKCKSKLYTDASKEGISMAFLYQCGQIGDQWLVCHTHQQKQNISMLREVSFGISPQA